MNNVLNFEFRKLFRQKSFYICGGIALLMAVLNLAATYFLFKFANGVSSDALTSIPTIALNGRYFLQSSISNANLTTILAVFIPLFVCSDYNEGVIKNILSRGIQRNSLLVAKYVSATCASLIITVLCYIISFVPASLIWGLGSDWTLWTFLTIPVQLLIIMAVASLYIFISVGIKKTGAAIVLCIFAPSVVQTILQIIDYLIKGNSNKYSISDIFVTGLITLTGGQFSGDNFALGVAALCSVGYFLLFAALSSLVTYHRDY